MTNQTPAFTGLDPVSEMQQASQAIRRVAVIALMAVALGFVMQGLILATKLTAGGTFPGMLVFLDLAQGVSWSVVVCTGVGIGTTLAKARAALAGFIAMIFAPVGVAVAKASQKIVAGLIGAAEQPAMLSLATISVLRAVEYGLLGWLLAVLAQKDVARALPYLAIGAAIGVFFGGSIAALGYQAALINGTALKAPQIAASLVNEIGSPLGCALLIYLGQVVTRSYKAFSAYQA